MRRALILCLLLAGCSAAPAPPSFVGYQPPPEVLAAYDRQMGGPPPGAARRDGLMQADAICRARADIAGATYSGRGFGLAGAMTAGFEAGIAAERVRVACLDAYQRTGIMPTL